MTTCVAVCPLRNLSWTDSPGFVRYNMMRLDLGHDLESFKYGCKRIIAPAEKVLALRPELKELIAKREMAL